MNDTPKKKQDLSRRAFLGLGATAAVAAGAAGLAACAPRQATESSSSGAAGGSASAAGSQPAFLTPPSVPTNIKETRECDVLVIGLGLSGSAAVKAATEEGAKVIGIDKTPEHTVITMAGDFGVVDSQVQKDLGITWADKDTIVNQLMKDMCYRPNAAFLNYWYDHSGADFDWLIEGSEFEVLPTTASDPKNPEGNIIRPKCFPALEGFDPKTEYFPYYHGTITTDPSMQWACSNAVAKAEEKGAELIFGTWGEQLIVENGKVVGAYVRDAAGSYTQINAKSVVISTGDMSGNPDMVDHYIPWVKEFAPWYPVMDAEGKVANTGDGHQMAMWAGAQMELGPLAPMTHHMGGALGVDSFLQLNMEGDRFMNEDIPGQPIANQLSRQPASQVEEERLRGRKSWQIFDASWPEQIKHMPDGHGYTNHFVPAEEVEKYATVLSGFGLGYTTQALVDAAVPEAGGVIANTIEELAAGMGLPVEKVKASIDRYNELCAKGHDDDFGKDARRLFPVVNPPFYATPFEDAGLLVIMGGIQVNKKLQPLNANNEPIEGLYITGNAQGGRYLVEYPITVAGLSLATALTFGRLAGQNAAGADISA